MYLNGFLFSTSFSAGLFETCQMLRFTLFLIKSAKSTRRLMMKSTAELTIMLLSWAPILGAWSCVYAKDNTPFSLSFLNISPNPSVLGEEVALNFRGHLFEKTHVIVLSSCRINNFSQPLHFLDSQVTAEWNQTALLEFEPARTQDLQVYVGAGYSLKRYAFSSHFGERLFESISPSALLPITFAYSRENRFGSKNTFLKIEYEFDGEGVMKNSSLLHQIGWYKNVNHDFYCLLSLKEMLYYQNIIDQNSAFQAYQIGLSFEHRSH